MNEYDYQSLDLGAFAAVAPIRNPGHKVALAFDVNGLRLANVRVPAAETISMNECSRTCVFS